MKMLRNHRNFRIANHSIRVMFTFPGASVKLDPEAGVFRMNTVRYEADTTSNQRRIDFTQLGHVSVGITLEYLHPNNSQFSVIV